ncbi:MAG: hypothetical protein RL377_1185 [Bacteroidota bacterium]|jgi:hypothetical protein
MKNYILLVCLTLISILSVAQNKLTETSFKVFGECEQCKSRIELAAKLKGVQFAVWDMDTKMLLLSYDPNMVSLDKIQNKIVAVGHDLMDKKANNQVYNALPACCHYRESSTKEETASNNFINGIVLQENAKGRFEPLVSASIYWLGTTSGTLTDSTGVFSIPVSKSSQKLIVNYTGFKTDTLTIVHANDLKIIMAAKGQLTEVTVLSKQFGNFIPYLNPIRTQVISSKELLKAACCNLSESFETNPSVDVSYNDAVTGSKQIQLLGLSGNYTQLTVENLPGPRGLATPLGLSSIAGPWIESIQLTKGVGSVANGFESIAGQINVELVKPETADKLLGNIYVNNNGKTDLNLNLTTPIDTKWSTSLLLHDNFLNTIVDMNGDGFKDMPTGNELSLINRYKYDDGKGVLGQLGIKVLNDEKLGGQNAFNSAINQNDQAFYGISIQTKRVEAFAKLGYVFPQQKYKSIGLQIDVVDHQQHSFFGLTNYNAIQQGVYGNLIYQSIINSTIHKFRTGLSFQYDKYDEILKTTNYNRKEIVPGAFFEYTYTPNEKWSAVAGMRIDNNNLYGAFATPRLNIRYEPFKGTVFRLSAGRGQRTANVIAENNSVLASARQLVITQNINGGAYGLQPEVAWNKGISFDQKLTLFGNPATLGIDYFRNDFINQVIIDLENARTVQVYNLNGKSFSNSFQAELNMNPLRGVDIRLAYRYFDVQQNYNGKILSRPFIAKHRAFASIDYASKNEWKFNYTLTYNGKKRITSTESNPMSYQVATSSPDYFIMNAQISKSVGKKHKMDFYVGAENFTNFYQQTAIIASDAPFSPYFDASMIWGPTTGGMWYAGWRIRIK